MLRSWLEDDNTEGKSSGLFPSLMTGMMGRATQGPTTAIGLQKAQRVILAGAYCDAYSTRVHCNPAPILFYVPPLYFLQYCT